MLAFSGFLSREPRLGWPPKIHHSCSTLIWGVVFKKNYRCSVNEIISRIMVVVENPKGSHGYKVQMELIQLQCNDTLKAKYNSVGTAPICLQAAQINALHGWQRIPVSATFLCDEDEHITQELSHWCTHSIYPENFHSSEPDPKHWRTFIQANSCPLFRAVCARLENAEEYIKNVRHWCLYFKFDLSFVC